MRTNLPPTFLEEMALFVQVAEAGSFSAVARHIGATPSAVSRSVARLERALGVPLLQRTTRRLGLSAQGAEILPHCSDLVQSARTVLALGGQLRQQPHGRVRISVPKAIGRALVHPHMADLLRAHPGVDVHLLLEDRALDLVEHGIDLALRVTDTPPVGLVGRRLMEIEHALCASPGYLAQRSTPEHPKDLAAHDCIALGENPGDARWRFTRAGQSVVVPVRGRYTANHAGVRLDAACQGLGIASLPCFMASAALQRGALVQVLAPWRFVTPYTGGLWLLYLPTRYLPAKVRVVVDFLAARLQQPPLAA